MVSKNVNGGMVMPVSLNGTYDALLVVLDERDAGNDSFFQKEMEHIFDKRKYVYYQNKSLSAEELWNDLEERISRDEIIFPVSERIVFCTYMDIGDLNQEWMDRFWKRMGIFKNRGMTRDGFQHYHLTFFRHQAKKALGEEKIHVVAESLNELWNPARQSMQHSEFLMYAGGLGANLNTQEKGMVRFLEILSTQDYARAITVGNYTDALFVLGETEYYERNAQNCREKIEEIQKWLNQERDANLEHFIQGLNIKVSEWVRRYREEMRRFQAGTGLYPISVHEYKPKGFLRMHYERPTGLHPELKNEKKHCQIEFLKGIADSEEKETWKENALRQMAFEDMQNLFHAWDEGKLQGIIQSAVENAEAAQMLQKEEREGIEKAFQKWIDELVMEKAAERRLQEMKSEKGAELLRYENEFARANIFQNLSVCFQQIKTRTGFQVPAVIPPTDMEDIAIINSQVGQDWNMRGYSIAGIRDADVIVLNDIYPYEIVYMKLGKYITLNQSDTEQQLRMVLC